jgi:EAL domain-containing protein (putative c-di-GMP-specific phosphodiesterase class I)/FixJ family two-component response regulator
MRAAGVAMTDFHHRGDLHMTSTIPLQPAIASLMVVDDSAVQRSHAAEICRELGVSLVYEAGNGEEALDLLSMLILPPCLLILDLEMPGMDGVELIQQLHQRGLEIPLIVASSRESVLIHSVETMARALGLQVLATLQKPIRREQLALAIERYGRGPRTAGRSASGVAAPLPSKAELARAIESGEIFAHYQPKVDIRTGIVRGVEALARWRHPENGLIPPDRFIPLAEQEGLIHALTLAMLEQAFAQAAVWNGRGLKLSVAINLSARLLDSARLVGEISALSDRHMVPPEQIVLEITESSVVAYLGAALGVLARLRLKGFGLSIDDYGTGFSSMQQLARIPFTELKIDRSFVHGAHQRRNLRVILQSALDMARRLELVTVAEGIETIDDWQLLQEFGCGVGQGYLIARPMAADDLPNWLRSHNGRLGELRARPAARGAVEPSPA